jgi:hypothetical protein
MSNKTDVSKTPSTSAIMATPFPNQVIFCIVLTSGSCSNLCQLYSYLVGVADDFKADFILNVIYILPETEAKEKGK